MRKSNCCNDDGKYKCNVWKCIAWGVLGVVGVVGFVAILGWVIMALWNAIIPGIFNLSTIGYYQAIGLAILSRLLFGGAGFRHMHSKHLRGKKCCNCNCSSDTECCEKK